eukprot:gene8488-9184_t
MLTQCQNRIKQLQQCYQQFSSEAKERSDGSSSSSSGSEKSLTSDGVILQLLHKIEAIDPNVEINCHYSPSSSSSHISKDPYLRQALENSRAYMSADGRPIQVILFAKELRTTDAIDEVLRHELTHVHDYLSRKYDMTTCEGLASSEVRAAKNGECFRYRHFPSFIQNSCIKKTAIASTCNIFPSEGENCVKRVFERSIEDQS